MPNKATWKRFVAELTEKVAPLMPVEQVEVNEGTAVLGWCGEPVAHVHCEAGGELRLCSVELEAWQPILLPRQWDAPEREPDLAPREQLSTVAERVREAIFQWGEAVQVLRDVDVSVN